MASDGADHPGALPCPAGGPARTGRLPRKARTRSGVVVCRLRCSASPAGHSCRRGNCWGPGRAVLGELPRSELSACADRQGELLDVLQDEVPPAGFGPRGTGRGAGLMSSAAGLWCDVVIEGVWPCGPQSVNSAIESVKLDPASATSRPDGGDGDTTALTPLLVARRSTRRCWAGSLLAEVPSNASWVKTRRHCRAVRSRRRRRRPAFPGVLGQGRSRGARTARRCRSTQHLHAPVVMEPPDAGDAWGTGPHWSTRSSRRASLNWSSVSGAAPRRTGGTVPCHRG